MRQAFDLSGTVLPSEALRTLVLAFYFLRVLPCSSWQALSLGFCRGAYPYHQLHRHGCFASVCSALEVSLLVCPAFLFFDTLTHVFGARAPGDAFPNAPASFEASSTRAWPRALVLIN